jgi:hypothetical protein
MHKTHFQQGGVCLIIVGVYIENNYHTVDFLLES